MLHAASAADKGLREEQTLPKQPPAWAARPMPAVAEERPAGLLHGIAPITAATGGGDNKEHHQVAQEHARPDVDAHAFDILNRRGSLPFAQSGFALQNLFLHLLC